MRCGCGLCASEAEAHVLGLEVAVDDALAVQMPDGEHNLRQVEPAARAQSSACKDAAIESSRCGGHPVQVENKHKH